MSRAKDHVVSRRVAYRASDRSAVAEIERNVIRLGKQKIFSGLFHSKDDKEKIAAWRLDLNRILHIFNVRFITSLPTFLTIRLQTELAINTHVAVVNTQNIVSDIHRTIVERQEGGEGGNATVSYHCTLTETKQILIFA